METPSPTTFWKTTATDSASISAHCNTIIKNNTIRDCQVGQDLWYADRGTILEGNLYDHNTEAIEVWYCQNVTFTRNTYRNNTFGIVCHVSHRNIFLQNNFEGNTITVWNIISRNHWRQNYWDQPRLLPKPLFGYPAVHPVRLETSTTTELIEDRS